jgi:hypothetical protein
MLQVLDWPHANDLVKPGGKCGSRDAAEPSQIGDRPAVRHIFVHRRESARRYRISKASEQPRILLVLSKTHIYNPHWPPHAKFHNGQTLSLSVLLGGLTIFLAWKSSKNVPMTVAAAGVASSLYFISQGTAILYPGTAYTDPEFQPKTAPRVPAAIVIDAVYLSAVVLACWLGLRGRWREARQSSP